MPVLAEHVRSRSGVWFLRHTSYVTEIDATGKTYERFYRQVHVSEEDLFYGIT